jgi:hypothetical protein
MLKFAHHAYIRIVEEIFTLSRSLSQTWAGAGDDEKEHIILKKQTINEDPPKSNPKIKSE